ncbi:MAG: tRNA (adenosine(37)-N6)-threonylcarbamoyltransferase complex transferase subunit TsaD [bacterium]|nr:tRNA (adenosine(37)-N6)-threonylcarbamoyltransferase complex transferase subunit TsaD [bacterium]MDT8395949.1 tRNA (adenosine(37)-N6)-threonylcarbamoyltransferase complex transferase subunit TsaD [bacterium]
MLTLGIETSCDDTAAAVIRGGTTVLSSVVQSQDDLHAPFGGIVPEMASRRHLEVITPVVARALKDADCSLADLDLISVTAGPGLLGSLLVGLSYAKGLSYATGLPLVPVDHIEGHLLTMEIAGGTPLPAVALISSGGHTALYHLGNDDPPAILGTTLDDAAGEALDKAAKMLGLGFPGGPALEKAALGGDPDALDLPRPMSGSRTLDFSFSGLKTALFTYLKREGYLDQTTQGRRLPLSVPDLAASYQRAVVETLLERCFAAATACGTPHLIIVGGVARNTLLREQAALMGAERGVNTHYPPHYLCTDNAAMIAALGYRDRHRSASDPMTVNAYSTKALKTRQTAAGGK